MCSTLTPSPYPMTEGESLPSASPSSASSVSLSSPAEASRCPCESADPAQPSKSSPRTPHSHAWSQALAAPSSPYDEEDPYDRDEPEHEPVALIFPAHKLRDERKTLRRLLRHFDEAIDEGIMSEEQRLALVLQAAHSVRECWQSHGHLPNWRGNFMVVVDTNNISVKVQCYDV